SSRPNAAATPTSVRSSTVGPRPPVVTTAAAPRSRAPEISRATAGGASAPTPIRATPAPAATGPVAVHAEVVSVVRPVKSSRPTATISTGVPDSSDMRRQVAALARDRVSGATALARRAARLLQAAARDDGKSVARWQQDLRALGAALVAAQP